MKTPNDNSEFPPPMLDKLREVRARDRRVRFSIGLIRGLTCLLAAMLAGMLADWLAGLYDPLARWALTLTILACAAAAIVWWAVKPFLRRRSLASLAGAVDQAHSVLQERYSTLVENAQSADSPELRGSETMLKKVAEQAAELSAHVSPDLVVRNAGLMRALRNLGFVAAAFLLVFVLDFSRALTLAERFWMPGLPITFTQLVAKPGNATIGKGEDVSLEFIPGGVKPDSASLFIRSDAGRDEVIHLKLTGATNFSYQFVRSSVAQSFQYRARAGDAQTPWYRVSVAERPKLALVHLRIIPPAYSKLPVQDEPDLPRRVRALEGSRLEADFQADQPIGGMQLKLSDGQAVSMNDSADHVYRFTAILTNTLSFTPEFTNQFRLDNQPKPSCQVVVYPDEPPTVKVLAPTTEITARPDDKLKIDFEARDDFGVASARLLVTTNNGADAVARVIPIPLKPEEVGAKLVRKQVELDLAQFNLKQDQELSYVVQVTDTKQNQASADPTSTRNPNRKESGKPSADSRNSKSDASAQGAKQQASAQNQQAQQDDQKHLPLHPSSSPGQDNQGSQPPPNNMTKRVLDAGQCSSCQPMRVVVDQWGRSFEGQQREKLEIAIDPVLIQLDALLQSAQQSTDGILNSTPNLNLNPNLLTGPSRQGLDKNQAPTLEASKDQLRQADAAVTELKGKTDGTPYAFIGLQLHDIRETHVSPARQNLQAVLLEPPSVKQDVTNLQQASFQIHRAREKLADLTKSYAAVKRDYKLADAMQRLQKMHQIFLEDSQAMLGSSKPTLNPQDRKVAEVDDAYVDKLQKLLEEKKKIMAELAKILADDPRMLRRFLALEQADATTLRDQMTLLAQRQKDLTDKVANWTDAGDTNRMALQRQYLAANSAEEGEVASLASQMHENMVTWLPLDVPPDSEPVADCRNLAAESARLAGDAARNTSPDTVATGLDDAGKSLDQLRLLYQRLPGLQYAEWSNPKLSAYSANRMTEVGELITRESGWIKKMLALQAGDFAQAAEVDQHRLAVDTTGLSEKLDAAVAGYSGLSDQIRSNAEELTGTVHKQILPDETGAADQLSHKRVKEAADSQAKAVKAFAGAENQFDELLRLIIAKLDAEPPPTDPVHNKSLEDMLAMLKDEQKAVEKLGIPCRPINVAVMKDWLKSGSGSGGMAVAQAHAAHDQAHDAAEKTQRASQEARKLAQEKAAELDPPTAPVGPKRPSRAWNTLVSQLGDELRQGRESTPPEQYRQAIEQYFETISERMPTSRESTNSIAR